jgi:2-C-methyl-D-erythritol 4-phosphate cytidylyltransferase
VRTQDIRQLIDTATATQAGGLLAVPVRDTMKRADADQQVEATVERDRLWHAMTPQCFPLQTLQLALQDAAKKGLDVTDEAAAMELAGHRPKLVQGADDNIKITRPYDLRLAQFYLGE